uniref:RRM domain-containing protein n=1 Tax=Chlamydomonas leiostraca TaxID=1034604 RepID=A0A7S0WJK0_9CHLO|mmetsp:Transcript_1571/g.4199  ORF Transcript_1571/g.4199 Transcript_1571/m.4199 type:complete len:346 (+) Transcript_1571:173-1210(+)|eukprot:CAMPEP_0202887220 /NCGR_PEP_ID=MMETSP1391-20130828/42568_1 /ASSEMBLY_ACC=CAM_ASM_000867 /TAXON_ID=1034604 /ORGANISM="Chlamydomonas leiostraca, Strain SAG 11-49" /LENGTH=345 /DNA_ID=CAMNT_0049570501 /DNA_START=113 /DNA_END=1150 /DNA_ORIENTATION=-
MAQEGGQTDFSVFVGDLAADVDDAVLENTFRTYYPSTKGAKVMLDPVTQRSRGYGFVRFSSEQERDRAITEMNGVYISTRPVRVCLATARRNLTSNGSAPGTATPGSAGGASVASSVPASAGGAAGGGEADPNNTTLFIGGLSPSVTEAELHTAFARFGEIVYTKIPQGKGCGFVQFVARPAAELAMQEMNGTVLGGMSIRISWGRSTGKPAAGGASHHGSHSASQHGAYGYYGDPYMYGYMYDPYGAGYTGYPGMDPYTAYGYGMHPHMAYPGMPMPAAGGASAVQAGGAPGAPGPVQPVMFDPMAPVNVERMNMAYMHRHIPMMTGAFMRMPMAMPVPMAGQI